MQVNPPVAGYVYGALLNGKIVYVGATKHNPLLRWKQHVRGSTHPRTSHFPFYRAATKYGWNAISMVMLHRGTDYLLKEVQLIKQLTPRYNVTAGGEGVSMPRPDLAEINKRPEIRAARAASNRRRAEHNGRLIVCRHTNLVFASLSDAAQAASLTPSEIAQCIRSNRKTPCGFKFTYLTEKVS